MCCDSDELLLSDPLVLPPDFLSENIHPSSWFCCSRCGCPYSDDSQACFLCSTVVDTTEITPIIDNNNLSPPKTTCVRYNQPSYKPPSSSPDQPLKPRWNADARQTHSQACMGKSRLSVQEKLDIVCMYYSAPSSTRCRRTVHQWDIARMYGKSRAAISKVLKPEYASRVMMTKEGEGVPERDLVLWKIREEGARREA